MSIRAFASSVELTADELESAPVRYPRPSRLEEPLKVRGQKAQKAAETLGLQTVGDLLEHLPRDRREARTIAELAQGESATIVVEVRSISSRSVRRRGMRPIVEATVADDTGVLKVTFFNQPWLVSRYPPGTRLVLHGRYQARNRFTVQSHAKTAEAVAGVGAVAHYPATDGLSSTQILTLVREHASALDDVLEPLPAALRTSQRLPDRPAALTASHFPDAEGDVEAARARLAFDELLLAQLTLLRRRRTRDRSATAPVLDGARELSRRWLDELLPFAPTGDQLRALDEIDDDLADSRPMQRLLMGEVGSGKTVVALYAMLRAVEHGYQAALMAPTETLAEQHFQTIQSLMPGEAVRVGLLTGSTPARRPPTSGGKLSQRRALAGGRHPRADRGGGDVRAAGGRGRRRAAPLRGQPAGGARREGAGRGPVRALTSCT